MPGAVRLDTEKFFFTERVVKALEWAAQRSGGVTKCSGGVWMWHLGIRFKGDYGGTWLTAGLGDLEGLFQSW